MFKSIVTAEIVQFLLSITNNFYWNPVMSDWYNLPVMGASLLGHQAEETTGNSGKGNHLSTHTNRCHWYFKLPRSAVLWPPFQTSKYGRFTQVLWILDPLSLGSIPVLT